MNEEELLNIAAQYMLAKTREVLNRDVPARTFGGQQKPIRGQFPPASGPKRASSTYINSLTYSVNLDPDDERPYISIFSNLPADDDYGVFIEQGRADGRKFPPISKIQTWIGLKGIQPQPLSYTDNRTGAIVTKIPTLKQLTYLISRSISEQGIFPYPFEQIVRDEVERELIQQLKPAVAQRMRTLLYERVVFKINKSRYVR